MSTLPKHSGANDESKFTSVVHTEPDPFVSMYYIPDFEMSAESNCMLETANDSNTGKLRNKASEPITAVMID